MTFLTTVKQTNKQTNNDCLNDFAAILVSSFSIKTDELSFDGNLLHINDLDSVVISLTALKQITFFFLLCSRVLFLD